MLSLIHIFLGEMAELQRKLGQLSVADDYSVDPMVWNRDSQHGGGYLILCRLFHHAELAVGFDDCVGNILYKMCIRDRGFSAWKNGLN